MLCTLNVYTKMLCTLKHAAATRTAAKMCKKHTKMRTLKRCVHAGGTRTDANSVYTKHFKMCTQNTLNIND